MKSLSWSITFWRLAMALLCTLAWTAVLPSAEEPSKRMETLYKEAAAAQVKMQFAQQELQRAAASLASAKTTEEVRAAQIDALTKAQAVVAKRFEDAAPATSPFAVARSAVVVAQEQLAAIRKERGSDHEHGSNHEHGSDTAAIIAARGELKKAVAELKRARDELLRGSVEWTHVEAELKLVRQQHEEAENAARQAAARHLALKELANQARAELLKTQTELLKAQSPPQK